MDDEKSPSRGRDSEGAVVSPQPRIDPRKGASVAEQSARERN